jgi:arginine/lysine/ornithine decarboxylase
MACMLRALGLGAETEPEPEPEPETGTGTQTGPVERSAQTRTTTVNHLICKIESCNRTRVQRNDNGLCWYHRGKKNAKIDRMLGTDYRRQQQAEAQIKAQEEANKQQVRVLRKEVTIQKKRMKVEKKAEKISKAMEAVKTGTATVEQLNVLENLPSDASFGWLDHRERCV